VQPGSSTTERVVQAADLLREALALLDGASVSSLMPASRRLPDRLLRLPEVERLTGLRRSAIYEQMRKGTFPRSVKAGARTATWSEAAIQVWIAERLATRSQ
jgi:predicted DNA-binding transcriptional regulator AlpA